MQTHEKVLKEIPRFEAVEWYYDGLKGKIIPWTLANGGHSHDPSVQAFIVAADGTVTSRAADRIPYSATSFAKWLAEQAAAFERAHPRTKMPFVLAATKGEGEGDERKVTCAELETAKKEKKRVVLYFGREARKGDDKAAKKQATASRKFQKKTLDAKAPALAAKDWVLLRFDLSDPDHRIFAKTLDVTAAPRLLLVVPGEKKPVDLGEKVSPSSLTYQLKKINSKKK